MTSSSRAGNVPLLSAAASVAHPASVIWVERSSSIKSFLSPRQTAAHRAARRCLVSRPRARLRLRPTRPPATQHSTAHRGHRPQWSGACRAGTRPRVCGAASRTHAPRARGARGGVNGSPAQVPAHGATQPSRSGGHTPQSRARRGRAASTRGSTWCVDPRPRGRRPPGARARVGQPAGSAWPDRGMRHGPVRPRVRVSRGGCKREGWFRMTVRVRVERAAVSGTCTPCQPFMAQNGAPWASPTAEACCRVRAGARARSAWSGRPCVRTERPRASLTSVPAHGRRSIPQRRHTHRARPAAAARLRRARRARAHGAWTARGLERERDRPGGRSGRLGASDCARGAPELRPRSPHTKTSPDTKKIIQNFPPPLPPPQWTSSAASTRGRPEESLSPSASTKALCTTARPADLRVGGSPTPGVIG